MALRPCRVSRPLAWLPCLVALVGCGGGGGSAPATPDDVQDANTGKDANVAAADGMGAMGEVGALDQGEVDRVFGAAMADVDRCLAEGRKRIRPLGGKIAVFLRVDRNGRVAASELRRSTLGDRDSTRCILGVYGKQQWPRPVGGKFGEIEHSHDFGVADADPPQLWSAERLGQAMAADASSSEAAPAPAPIDVLNEQLRGCMNESGTGQLDITFYLDEEGFVPTVGLSTDSGKEAAAYDCVATVLKTTSFPSPGQSPAKVTVSLQ